MPAPTVQKKMTVNEPDDAYEQEADQVADLVTRMSSAPPVPPPDDGDEPKKPGSRPQLQAKGAVPTDVAPEVANRVSRLSGGQPLPAAERAFFEPRMGADFSEVRIHTGGEAVQTAVDLNARAYTHSNNIAFSDGEYQPGSEGGRKLLAHELTHVVQQGAAGESPVQRAEQEPDAGQSDPSAGTDPAPVTQAPFTLPPALDGETLTTVGETEATPAPAQAPDASESGPSAGAGPAPITQAPFALPPALEGEASVTETPATEAPALAPDESGLSAGVGPSPVTQAPFALPPGLEGEVPPAAADDSAGPVEATTQTAGPDYGPATGPGRAVTTVGAGGSGYQTSVQQAGGVAATEAAHQPAGAAAGAAQSAAVSPPNEVTSQASAEQVGEMDAQQPQPFNAAEFKSKLMQKIQQQTPQTLEDADDFPDNNTLGSVQGELVGEVDQAREEAGENIEETAG